MAFDRTRVFCRPNQVREAAILISCLPKNGFPLLIVLSPPPRSEAEQRAIYKQTREALRRSMEDVGSSAARHSVLTGSPQKVQETLTRMAEHRALQRQLGPLRSWRLHNRMLKKILTPIPCDRAVFLFLPSSEDLRYAQPDIAESAVFDDPLVSKDIQRMYVLPRGSSPPDDGEVSYYDSLLELTSVAWAGLRGGTVPTCIDVPAADLGQLFYGLRDALRADAPLRIIPAPGVLEGLAVPTRDAVDETAAGEVVIVEEADNASHLLAVLYAHDRKLPLVCVSEPDLSEINQALHEFDQNQIRLSGVITEGITKLGSVLPPLKLDDEKIVPGSVLREVLKRDNLADALPDGLKELVLSYLGADRMIGLDKVRAAVSRHVPVAALRLVADRSVTAFTNGVPYGLLKKAEFDWSRKPIGHIAGDMTLLLLNEMTQGLAEQKNSFNLLFDPGYFETTETQDVFNALTNHYCHPVLLQHSAASLSALVLLPQTMPVEMIFFNTHGANDAIVLGGVPYSSDVLVQWVWLPSNPIVFNNSCLSWVGVGREFIRMGARGYIGTLWSVEAELAARFAKHVMSTLVSDNQPCSKAISTFSDATRGSQAYVYVGTANGGIVAQRDERALDFKATFFEYSTMLSNSILALDGSGHDEPQVAGVLYAQLTHFVSKIDDSGLSEEERCDFYARTLSVAVKLVKNFPNIRPDFRKIDRSVSAYVSLLKARFAAAGADAPESKTLAKDMLRHAHRRIAELQERRGNNAAALAELRSSVELAEDDLEACIYDHHAIAELLKRSGDWKGALEAATKTRELILQGEDEVGLLRINGVLGQLAKRTNDLDDAVRYANEGFDLAVKLGDYGEQAVFKADLAQVLLLKGDFVGAEVAALEAQRISSGNQNERGAIQALGILGHCYLAQDKLVEAESYAERGLGSALASSDSNEVAAFLLDLARIRSKQKRFKQAFANAMHSAQILGELGSRETEAASAGQAIEIAVMAKDWSLFTAAGMAVVASLVRLPEGLQAMLMDRLLQGMQQAVYFTDRDEAIDGVNQLGGYLQFLLGKGAGPATGQTQFLIVAITFYLNWLSGAANEAAGAAKALDAASGDHFRFCEFNNKALPNRSFAKVVWRKIVARLQQWKPRRRAASSLSAEGGA